MVTSAKSPLWGPWLRVERASELLEEFRVRRLQWIDSGAYDLYFERNDDATQTVSLRLVKPFPELLYCVVADVLGNLDAAMEQLATALAEHVAHCSDADLKRCHFPTGSSAAVFEANLARYKTCFNAAVNRFLCDVAPYKGGENEALFSLRQLNNRCKHHVVVELTPDDAIRVDAFGQRQWVNMVPYGETQRVIGCFPVDAEPNARIAIVAGVLMAGTGEIPVQRGQMLGFYQHAVARVLQRADETFFL